MQPDEPRRRAVGARARTGPRIGVALTPDEREALDDWLAAHPGVSLSDLVRERLRDILTR